MVKNVPAVPTLKGNSTQCIQVLAPCEAGLTIFLEAYHNNYVFMELIRVENFYRPTQRSIDPDSMSELLAASKMAIQNWDKQFINRAKTEKESTNKLGKFNDNCIKKIIIIMDRLYHYSAFTQPVHTQWQVLSFKTKSFCWLLYNT